MKSYWEEERKNHGEFAKVENNMKTSVCIVGGGITGLTVAYYLSKKMDVTVLEKGRICNLTSGNTTGKITSQHGTFYKYLSNSESKEFAEKYLEANERAIQKIEDIIKKENIDCDFERESSYVFTTKETDVDKIKEEQREVEKLKQVKSKFVKNTPLPMQIAGAEEFENQAKFHPIKYAYGLCDAILRQGGSIFEKSQVIDIKKEENKYLIRVNNKKIIADYVVVATRYPIIKIPGYYFLKMYQSTSFAMVFDVKQELFTGMYINYETPTISFRIINDGHRKLLLAVGYDYKTGSNDIKDGYLRLETTVRKMYPNADILYKWTAEDCITLDKIPYIGKLSNMMPNVYVATGFNKWGLTSSNIAANIIADYITGITNEYADLFKSTRVEPIKNREEVGNILKEANKSIVMSKFKIPNSDIESLKIGEGKIVHINNAKVGVYKDSNGKIHKVKPVCTHLGCELYFNNIDKIWECPCHGSKYTCDGECIETPANKNLKYKNT